MGSVSGENGVLKLVYPGRLVEIHKNPITAAEVMKRNPRHCVTRPDVFKFPWIVVRPESVLKPGRVFYVVPYHTIHRLLQSKDYKPRPKVSSRIDAILDNRVADQSHDHWLQREQDDLAETSVELNHNHRLVKRGNCRSESQNNECEATSADYYSAGSKYINIGNEKYQHKFYRKQFDELKCEKDSHESPKKPQVWQWKKETQLYNLFLDENDDVQSLLLNIKPRGNPENNDENDDVKRKARYDTERVELKSCLKKHNNIAKSRGFRVRFVLEEDDTE